MTTLLDFYKVKKDTYAALLNDAQSNFAEAAMNLAEAQAEYDTQLGHLAGMEREAKEIRRSLAAALMPSDIEGLAADLRVLLDKVRNGRAVLLAAAKQVATIKIDKQLAEIQLKREEGNVKKADSELPAAKERQKHHTSWYDTVEGGTPKALVAKAVALLDVIGTGGNIDPEDPLAREKKIVAEAKQRVVADIPESLRTRALERGQHLKATDAGEAGLLNGLKKEAGLYQESTGGVSGKTAKRWMEFLQAEDAYRELVLQGQSRYDKALALFFSITKSAALTEDEKARITDVHLVEKGKEAADLEKAYDQAKAAVDAKKFDLLLAIAKVQTKNLDENAVNEIRNNLNTLETDLAVAEGAYTADDHENLDLWEASIPDHIWANLVSYDEALTLLTTIKNGNPEVLATAKEDMNKAETALVTALEEQDLSIRTNNFLEDTLVKLEGQTKYTINSRQQRLLSAIRGD